MIDVDEGWNEEIELSNKQIESINKLTRSVELSIVSYKEEIE